MTEQRLTRANKHVCGHTFERTHLSPECAAQTEQTHRLSFVTGVIFGFAVCLMAVKLGFIATEHHQNNHLLLSKEALSSGTMTPTHVRTCVPVPPRTLSNMFSLHHCDKTDTSHFERSGGTKIQRQIIQSRQTGWFHNVW